MSVSVHMYPIDFRDEMCGLLHCEGGEAFPQPADTGFRKTTGHDGVECK